MGLTIYGGSDDLVDIEGDYTDEIGCYDASVEITIGTKEGGGLLVTMVYGHNGCWGAFVQQLDEDVPIPWPVRIEHAGRYSGRHGGRRREEIGYSVAVIIDGDGVGPVATRAVSNKSSALKPGQAD